MPVCLFAAEFPLPITSQLVSESLQSLVQALVVNPEAPEPPSDSKVLDIMGSQIYNRTK
jgi:hypothetical protein